MGGNLVPSASFRFKKKTKKRDRNWGLRGEALLIRAEMGEGVLEKDSKIKLWGNV